MSGAPANQELWQHRRLLWNICYRMIGCAQDADDLVQDTFTRALLSPPQDRSLPIKPWLISVAMNLARDQLRKRRRRHYVGPWLPTPVELASEERDQQSPETRYSLCESASVAFLLAIESLSPRERSILLLRDVFDFSVAEAAGVLGMAPGALKVAHLRARRRMREYDTSRLKPDAELRQRTLAALSQLLTAVASGDVDTLKAMLSADAVLLNDSGGGEFLAARRPIYGPDKITRLLIKLRSKSGPQRGRMLELNGMPAVLLERLRTPPREAPRISFALELDHAGKVRRIYTTLASQKLSHLSPGSQ